MRPPATDNAIGVDLLGKVVEDTPTVTRAYVDAGFKDDVAIHGAVLGITVEQVKRSTTATGFVPVAKRWVVERTHGRGGRHVVRGPDRLGVQHDRGRILGAAGLLPRLAAQQIVDGLIGAIVTP